jgi:hypothetical protein
MAKNIGRQEISCNATNEGGDMHLWGTSNYGSKMPLH